MIRVPVSKPPEMSRRKATVIALASLVTAAAAAPTEALDLATSPVGIGGVIAIAAGFGPRATLSLKPWVLTAVGVITYGVAKAAGEGSSIVLNVAALVSLVGALMAAYTLRNFASIDDRVEQQSGRHIARKRWGAALVALSAAAVVVGLRVVASVEAPDDAALTQAPKSRNHGIVEAPYRRVRTVGNVKDPRIVESSGLVASGSNAGVLWTHNDSGDGPFLYCLRTDGSSCGRSTLIGATATDWEDIAATTSEVGPMLYIGDIGDNARTRAFVTVYEVPEPELVDGLAPATTAASRSIDLIYPDGAQDAESLLIHPVTKDLYLLAKGGGSVADVYKAAAPLTARERLRHVGKNRISANLVDRTGADISADGSRVAIATYGGIYELVAPADGPFDAIWMEDPSRVGGPFGRQIEAVAYASDGRAIFFTEEHDRPKLWMAEWLLGR